MTKFRLIFENDSTLELYWRDVVNAIALDEAKEIIENSCDPVCDVMEILHSGCIGYKNMCIKDVKMEFRKRFLNDNDRLFIDELIEYCDMPQIEEYDEELDEEVSIYDKYRSTPLMKIEIFES
jgi:hypothetical protein